MLNLFSKDSQKLSLMLRQNHQIWVVYLDLQKFHEIEFRHGYEVCKHVLELIKKELQINLKNPRDLFLFSALEPRGGDDFVLYFIPGENTPCKIDDITKNWLLPIEEALNQKISSLVNEKIKFRCGVVLCLNDPERSPEYLLYAAVKEAFLLNKSESDPKYFVRRNELTKLLNEPDKFLEAAFQPIVSTKTGEIFGFEALARISGDTSFPNIGDLFPFAEKINQLYPIETLCRRQAIISSSSILQPNEYLFLNINPQVLNDPDFASGQTRKLLLEQGLLPSNVILEITERSAIENFSSFRTALEHYRHQGYQIALDDVGAGYSSIQSIAELHPDFLKVDRSLIKDVNIDPTKWALLETFVTFSKRIGCKTIAEGVETEHEMHAIVKLGFDFVQGYFLAKPNFERAKINPLASEIIGCQRQNVVAKDREIYTLIEPLPLFNPETLVQKVQKFFQEHSNQSLIGVVNNHRIVGSLQREKFYAALSTTYGVALYLERPISLLMDKNPLVVEDSTPIEVVSSLAMERSSAQLYEGVIVVNQKRPIGMVSIAALMKSIAERQIQIARGANPLTGLPGNIQIDQELRVRISIEKPFAVIYGDLNHFKYYNDTYGFHQGDLAIKMLGDILVTNATSFDKKALIGHIGGDDFIIIIEQDYLQQCCKAILESFEHLRQSLMGANDLTLSLAGLRVESNKKLSPFTIGQRATQIKKAVKQLGKNAYLISQIEKKGVTKL